jgi:hypothetical protein
VYAVVLRCRDLARRQPARAATPAREPLYELQEGIGFTIRHAFLRLILLTALFFQCRVLSAPSRLRSLRSAPAWPVHGRSWRNVGHLRRWDGGRGRGRSATKATVTLRPKHSHRAIRRTSRFPGHGAGAADSIYGAWLNFFLIGAGPILCVVSSSQVVTPAAMLGRVSALITTAAFGARPIGSFQSANDSLKDFLLNRGYRNFRCLRGFFSRPQGWICTQPSCCSCTKRRLAPLFTFTPASRSALPQPLVRAVWPHSSNCTPSRCSPAMVSL